jgi:hypothetical protein
MTTRLGFSRSPTQTQLYVISGKTYEISIGNADGNAQKFINLVDVNVFPKTAATKFLLAAWEKLKDDLLAFSKMVEAAGTVNPEYRALYWKITDAVALLNKEHGK